MIWVAGEIRPDDGLAIPAADRTFEHGLGLFETLRTWGGRAPLLDAHRARMLRSAEALRIPVDPARLPDADAVAQLLAAHADGGDRLLRITASGGSHALGSVVWMRSRSLGPAMGPIRVRLGSWTIPPDDPLARHKTLNYWARRLASESALARGFEETLGRSGDSGYVEGSRSNLFAIRGDELTTPSLDAPIIPGILRGLVLELAGSLDLAVREVPGLDGPAIRAADEVFLTNSVRGIVPVARVEGPESGPGRDWIAVGPWTRTLQARLADRLAGGGLAP